MAPPIANTKHLPSRQEILDFIAQSDGKAVRRDIARAFKIKGADRKALRDLLKEMETDGTIAPAGRRGFSKADEMPPVAPVDVTSVDDDGDLHCTPADWRGKNKPPAIRIAAGKTKPVPGVGDRLLIRLRPTGNGAYDGDIIRAIGNRPIRFLAVLRKKGAGGIAEPVERKNRNSYTIDKNDMADAKDGDLVWVEAKSVRGYGPKKGRVRSIEGHIDDRNSFSLMSLANHGIPVAFPDNVIAEANKAKLQDLGKRTDLRATPLLTIDPADAKDHDDAVWAELDGDPENEGGFKVIVAIADVSYFVQSGSALDREAQKRGNSTYLPDRVVPMLPEQLSNNLCSLRENEDRPCLAVEMILTAGGVMKEHRFLRGIMRSAGKLSYEDAQAIIDGKKHENETAQAAVQCLFSAYKARLKERQKRAPLDLDLPERKIILDKKGFVKNVAKRERFDAHRLIEEFMILSNVAAAETLERKKIPLIYRVHDQPDSEKLDGVREHLNSLDYSLIKGGSIRPSHFNQLLAIAEKREQKEMVSDIILRSQSQAVYATENLGHFGLNLTRYAHFTSPIRRYADLTVHRALISAAKLGDDGQSDQEAAALSDIAQSISDLERRSIAAERESKDRYLSAFLSDRIGEEFDGRIRGVTKFGLFVMLDETGADGFIPMRSLGFERFRFEEKHHAIIGETTGGVFRLGQAVRVKLAEATPISGGLRFDMISDPLADPNFKRRKKNTSKKQKRKVPKSKRPTKKAPKKKKKTNKDKGKRR